ncbi:MAG: hypothetical protein SCH71_07185 [Desulfobulbaceae bacterium]|nr:hypothetical protein [Desulfobulbaceae bacterium]
MRLIDSKNNGGRVLEAVLVSLFFLLVFYADFVLLKTNPMFGSGRELIDPVVSFANFEPGFRVFQYELMQHQNLLWSNLRSMGLPLLANDIQAAPLFPLTLLLFWVPADYYWNIFVVARLLLMGAGAYLLARDFLKFRSIPAAFFVLCFIYSLFVLQWMNHPWQNGLLAGIWYLYFLQLLPGSSRSPYGLKRFLVVLGLAVSVYAMVTCGFPEGAAMSAVLVVLVYTPFLASLLFTGRIRVPQFILDLVIAHAVGFALSAAQIFSIVEMLSLFEGSDKRGLYGLRQFSMKDFFPFWAENIALITGEKPSLFKDSRTYFGLIPLFFFVLGIARSAGSLLRLGYREIGALLCGVFILLKLFPFWEGFNRVVGSLPILKESYFFVYFLSIFLWGFAFFAARGVQSLLYEDRSSPGLIRYGRPLLALLSASAVIALLWMSVPAAYGMTFSQLLKNAQGYVHLIVLFLFTAAVLLALLFLRAEKMGKMRIPVGMALLSFAVLEMFVILPRDFSPLVRGITRQSTMLARDIENRGISPAEVRIQDPNGTYVSGGIATIDNGAPALLPERLFIFRRTLFDLHGGYFPVRKPYYDYSWALTSTALFPSSEIAGAPVARVWKESLLGEGGNIQIDTIRIDDKEFGGPERTVSGDQTLYLKGWAAYINEGQVAAPPVFIVFRSGDREVTLPTRRMVRQDVAQHLKNRMAIKAGFEVRIKTGLLEPGTYGITVRGLYSSKNAYFEENTNRRIIIRENTGEPEAGSTADTLHVGVTGRGFVDYDKQALPRAYLASRCFPVDHLSESVRHIADNEKFRLGDIFVEELSEAEKNLCYSVADDKPARVPITQDLGKEIQLGPVAGPGVLVLNDTYYPGWQAVDRISGEQLQIKPANIAMRALILPEDREYRIMFTYVPEWLAWARILFWAAFASLAALLFLALFRTRSTSRRIGA